MKIHRIIISLATIVSCVFFLAAAGYTEVPQTVNYQGYLTDYPGGSPVNVPKQMTFRIYDVPAGGTALWEETHAGVDVNNGVYSAVLGSVTAIDLAFDTEYWLGVEVETDGEMLPRHPLTSVPYALTAANAEMVDGYEGASLDQSAHVADSFIHNFGGIIVGENSDPDGRGVSGQATATGTVQNYGGYFTAAGEAGRGVYGEATGSVGFGVEGQATGAEGVAVTGLATGANGLGVRGEAIATGDVTNYGGFFSAAGATGRGVSGQATDTGNVTNYGGYFTAAGANGLGVYGLATAASGINNGVWGESASTEGRGVLGLATASSGTTWGVYGANGSTAGKGVYGTAYATSGTTYGLFGESASTEGRGVYGQATDTGNVTNYGGWFTAAGASGKGVFGEATGAFGRGVWGAAANAAGSVNYGGYFTAAGSGGRGVFGQATGVSGIGVRGLASNTAGVTNYGGRFTASGSAGLGVAGEATGAGGKGVYGKATSISSWGVFGEVTGTAAFGVYGLAGGVDSIGVTGVATGTFSKGVYGDGTEYDFFAAGAGQDYGTASSIRWKKNIVEIDNALEQVSNLRGVYFNWDEEHGGQHDMGFIAEEVGEVVPEVVAYEVDGVYATGLDYGALTPLLVQAIKELRKENEGLKARIDALERGPRMNSQEGKSEWAK